MWHRGHHAYLHYIRDKEINLFHCEANLKHSCRDLIDVIKKLITPYSQGKWSVTRSCAENQIHITPNEHPAPLSRVLRLVGSLRALTPEGRRGRFWGCLVSPKCKMPGLTFCQSFPGPGYSGQQEDFVSSQWSKRRREILLPLSISRQEGQSQADPTIATASSVSICSASRSRIQTRSWREVSKKTQEAGKD